MKVGYIREHKTSGRQIIEFVSSAIPQSFYWYGTIG